jgi:hypothetical protein
LGLKTWSSTKSFSPRFAQFRFHMIHDLSDDALMSS